MVDITTHHILDMIDSREYGDVLKWLKTYPNLKVVSRDGSSTYHNAIKDAHPKAIQISDRFHLLKNLTTYASEYLKKNLKQQVLIPVPCHEDSNAEEPETITPANKNRKLTMKEKYERIEQLLALGKSKTVICQSVNMDVRAYDRLMAKTPEERNLSFSTKMMTVHETKVQLKMERVNEVRELKKAGYSIREIMRRTGIMRSTIRKYLGENFNLIHATYGKKKIGKLTPYIKDVDAFLEKGVMGSYIENKIREMGYNGSTSTVRHYISDWKKRRKFFYDKSLENGIKTETIERKNRVFPVYS